MTASENIWFDFCSDPIGPADPLERHGGEKELYLVDLNWFGGSSHHIHARRPMYSTTNFIEFFILDDDGEIMNSVKFTDNEIYRGDRRYRLVDKARYDLIKRYWRE